MKADDFSYTANVRGYMVQYKGENIGGASIMGPSKARGRAVQIQIKDNAQSAKSTIQSLLKLKGGDKMKRGSNLTPQKSRTAKALGKYLRGKITTRELNRVIGWKGNANY
jgi:hypothetical protein